MKVIDARSGDVVTAGSVVRYAEGEWYRVIDIDEGLLSADATIEYHYPNGSSQVIRAPLTVRFLHPNFLFQKIAFVQT